MRTNRREFAAASFVLSVVLLLFGVNSVLIIRYGSFIPRADDWVFVPGIVGCGRLDFGWLWQQTADHRVPLQKLVMWLLWQLSPGDLRLAMLAGFWGLAVGTIAMILLLWWVRRRAEYSDVYFPVVLLTFGHAGVFLWWTTTGVPWVTALASLSGMLLVANYDRPSLKVATAIGLSAITLPLLGSSGAVFSCTLALALLLWAASSKQDVRVRRLSFVLSSLSIVIIVLYVLSFDRSGIQSPQVSYSRWIEATFQFWSMGLGIGAKRFWPAVAVVPTLLLVLMGCQIFVLIRRAMVGLISAGVLVAAISGPVLVALAVGWGRQYQGGLVDRYVLYAVPFYCVVYMFFARFRLPFLSPLIHYFLCFFAMAGLFWGFSNGLALAKSIQNAQESFVLDVDRGLPLTAIVVRHANRWGLNEASFAGGVELLRRSGIEPFRRIREDGAWHEMELPIMPSSVENAALENGTWICRGRQSELIFQLRRPEHVLAVRCQYVLHSQAGSTIFRLRWREDGSGDCFSDIREMFVFKGFNTAKPRRLEQQTFWIDEVITAFALSPSETQCQFELRKVILITTPGDSSGASMP